MLHPITEIFSSIQGEGPFTGYPTIFIRYAGCNLRCKWGDSLCDTPYSSWVVEKTMLSTKDIIKTVTTLIENYTYPTIPPAVKTQDIASLQQNNYPIRICITGGEPTMHKGLLELCTAISMGIRTGVSPYAPIPIDIETNGTGPIPDEITTIVCSPKLSDSMPKGTVHEANHERIRKKLHPCINGTDPRLYLKFVVTETTPIDEITSLVSSLSCSSERVYLMPEGKRKRDIEDREPFVKTMAETLGYNYATRLHVLLWGDKRGV